MADSQGIAIHTIRRVVRVLDQQLRKVNSERWSHLLLLPSVWPLCIPLSKDIQGSSLEAVNTRIVKHFPHSQHRPIFLEVGIQIPVILRRMESEWSSFSRDLDSNLRFILSHSWNHQKIFKTFIKAAKKHMPKLHQKAVYTRMKWESVWGLSREWKIWSCAWPPAYPGRS